MQTNLIEVGGRSWKLFRGCVSVCVVCVLPHIFASSLRPFYRWWCFFAGRAGRAKPIVAPSRTMEGAVTLSSAAFNPIGALSGAGPTEKSFHDTFLPARSAGIMAV